MTINSYSGVKEACYKLKFGDFLKKTITAELHMKIWAEKNYFHTC